MPVDILLGQDGDLALVNGGFKLTETIEQSSKQQVLISLNTYRGEWNFNTLAGIPYLINENNSTQVLGKSTKILIDAAIQQDILDRENIEKITNYESVLDKAKRKLSINFEAVTLEGSTLKFTDSLAL